MQKIIYQFGICFYTRTLEPRYNNNDIYMLNSCFSDYDYDELINLQFPIGTIIVTNFDHKICKVTVNENKDNKCFGCVFKSKCTIKQMFICNGQSRKDGKNVILKDLTQETLIANRKTITEEAEKMLKEQDKMKPYQIFTCDGKYKTINENGTLTVYRHGELWRKNDLIGDGYVLSLVQRIEELENKDKKP